MKNFSYPAYRLSAASRETRLIYSLFLVLVAAGLFTTWILQYQRIGLSYERIVAYYLGGEIAGQISFPKNFAVLLEEAHFHTFIMGIVFLVLAHLFIATSLTKSIKYFVVLLAFFSTILDIGAIWLVRYVSPLFAYLLMAAWIGLWLAYLALIVVPVFEMWVAPIRRAA